MHVTMLLTTAALTIVSADAIERASPSDQRPTLTVTSVAKEPPATITYYRVTSAADLDGDGRPDVGLLRVTCSPGQAAEAAFRYHEWRWQNAAGSAKRTHAPVTFVKKWGSASPEMRASKVGYDLKKNEKARQGGGIAHEDSWTGAQLSGGPLLCPESARGSLNSSRSNRAGAAFTIEEVAADFPATIHFLEVASSADLDRDGRPDLGLLRLICVGGSPVEASYAPREAGSGMASGRRTHKPITFVKEWGPASPKLANARLSYAVEQGEPEASFGSGSEKWMRISLSQEPELCPDAAAAINTSHSNIK